MNGHPLTSFPAGTRVTVVQLDGGSGAKSKLYSLGLVPGTEVQIISKGYGPCRMKLRGSEIVLGRGMAEKILAYESEQGRS